MTQNLYFIFIDQLSDSLSCLAKVDKENDIIMLCESHEEATYIHHHPKKLAFLFSSQRHFAEALQNKGYKIRYITFDDSKNKGFIEQEIIRAVEELQPQNIICTEPSEWRLLEKIQFLQNNLKIPITILPDTRFLCSKEEFNQWAEGKKQLRMEFFYREMRKKYNILMELDGSPTGGKWNYDQENRQPPKEGMTSPKRISHKKDKIVLEVLEMVKKNFSGHFGKLEPFYFATTREEALQEAEHFMLNLLPYFGEYQDAMVAGEAYLYHSLLSAYLNAGLLLPLELCFMAERAYRLGNISLNSAEGYIRQILGWREYVRGIYWRFMPEYARMNYFNAKRNLPGFYWGYPTKMFCVNEAVEHTNKHAYSHHIQRLMVTGNFALLAGIDPLQVCRWYLEVYADAYDWVELPNTLGMALFGDGGIMASKPYAASGKYINRMSNFCHKCHYNPNKIVGDKACPFNSLYWNFIASHQDKLRHNHRMSYMYVTWDRFNEDKKLAIKNHAKKLLENIEKI